MSDYKILSISVGELSKEQIHPHCLATSAFRVEKFPQNLPLCLEIHINTPSEPSPYVMTMEVFCDDLGMESAEKKWMEPLEVNIVHNKEGFCITRHIFTIDKNEVTQPGLHVFRATLWDGSPQDPDSKKRDVMTEFFIVSSTWEAVTN